MNSPTTALAWEVWQRHRARLLVLAGVLLAFILIYPQVCALAGINLTARNVLDEFGKKLAPHIGHSTSPGQVIWFLCGIFLLCGPTIAMSLSLLYVTWMFTLAEMDPKTRRRMVFAPRLFNFPVSTSFLYWWFMLAGQAAIVAVLSAWTYLVRQPLVEPFVNYHNCLLWLTLLVFGQAIVWALSAWPAIASLGLASLLLTMMVNPAASDFLKSMPVLSGLYLLGLVVGRVGLGKARDGQWQGLDWAKDLAAMTPAKGIRGPNRFAAAAQAQLWFEWRRSGQPLCIVVGVCSLGTTAVLLVLQWGLSWEPLTDETTSPLAIGMLLLPLLLHYGVAMVPRQSEMSFIFNRPAATGQFVMARLKAAAISALVMWTLSVTALGGLTLLGNMNDLREDWQLTIGWPLLLLALLFLSWRVSAVNLCFTWSGRPRLIQVTMLMLIAAYVAAGILLVLKNNPDRWNLFLRLLPAALAGLVVMKFVLAFLAFRLSLKRGLLAPSAMAGYLATWVALAAALLAPVLIRFHGSDWILALCLGIVLLIPLARIGFCPITLSWNRHA